MPAPPAEFLAHCRAGTVTRHILFHMPHVSGTARAWDGLGEFVFQDETYIGVGGVMFIEGLSNSHDIQNHEIIVKFVRNPWSQLQTDFAAVRKQPVTITGVWRLESGAVVASRVLFNGEGRNVESEVKDDTADIFLRVRGKFADWNDAPKSYWTPVDQQRLFPGDTGFAFVPGMQNATVTGWSKNVETSGSSVTYLSGSYGAYADSVTSVIVGLHGLGNALLPTETVGAVRRVKPYAMNELVEASTGALLDHEGPSAYAMRLAGVRAYLDLAGDVRTGGGQLVIPQGGSTANKLRRIGSITVDGAATAETVSQATNVLNRTNWGLASQPLYALQRSGVTYGANSSNTTPLLLDNARGLLTSATAWTTAALASYVENVTGTALTYTASKLQIGGADCKVSTTGVLLSPANRRIIRSGGDPTRDYLRFWT
jgi:hypothetical protein